MNYFIYFHDVISNIAEKSLNITNVSFNLDAAKSEEHGDLSTNIAMVLRAMHALDIEKTSAILIDALAKHENVEKVEFAKPGFINIFIKNSFWQHAIQEVLKQNSNYGKNIHNGEKEKVLVEYVSANPTGPLHIGHARGAVIGDVLANLYQFAGKEVLREYYINDAGGQVEILAKSLYFRYLELLGKQGDATLGKDFYPGEYLIPVAQKLVNEYKDAWVAKPESEAISFMKDYGINSMMEIIKEDLSLLSIKHDVFSSERAIATDAKYHEMIEELKSRNLYYIGKLEAPKGEIVEDFEAREQPLFRSTKYGDDSDRAFEKSNGERTYFANDVVYHYDKMQRGYSKLVDVWGADHIGYIKRMKSAVSALSDNKVNLQVILFQLVNLFENGLPVRMSKRSGNFVTLRDLVGEVGKDIVRFMMITRKSEVALDFDLVKAKEQTSDNHMFYIQYAYARINSVINNAKEVFPSINEANFEAADFSLLNSAYEINIMKAVLKFPKVIDWAGTHNDVHRLYLFLMEVAKSFHALWNKGKDDESLRFIIKDNEKLTVARLFLLKSVAIVIANTFSILNIEIHESM